MISTGSNINSESRDPADVAPVKPQPEGKEDKIKLLLEEQSRLRKELQETQQELAQSRQMHDVLKMKSTVTVGHMRLQIDSLEEDKLYLAEKCKSLEDKLDYYHQAGRSFEDSCMIGISDEDNDPVDADVDNEREKETGGRQKDLLEI